ncbi:MULTISPECIES: DUF5425 family lipoprotein [Borreliella]|uniref:Lipoprotein n=2 Tax=Borreliella TaxID=64895 RepID=C0R8W6_BORVA|nr:MULTISPECIES: DUF5425 family lipoprotein [Borreliella]ACN52900.1 conserved hypothetical protein [Borreliella valaisiana VS116]
MNKKFIISLLFIISTFLLVFSCDLSINSDQNKMDGDLDYKCLLSKKESGKLKNSQIKDDNNSNNSYYFRVSNYSNSYSKTYSSCKTK